MSQQRKNEATSEENQLWQCHQRGRNNAFVNNKTRTGSPERGRVGLDRRDGGPNKIRCSNCDTTKRKFKVSFTVIDDHHVKNSKTQPPWTQSCATNEVDPSCHHQHQPCQQSPTYEWPHKLKITEIEETYHDLLEGLGNHGPKLDLKVDPEVLPVQIPPRKIPESVRQPLREHLEQIFQQGVIELVDFPTDWVSPIVVTL